MTKNYLPQVQVLRTLADMQTMNLQDGISVLVAEDLTVYQISSVTRAGAITLDNGKYAIPTLIGGSGTQSNADFLKQAKAVGLAENELEDVSLFKLGEKVEDTDIGKEIGINTKKIAQARAYSYLEEQTPVSDWSNITDGKLVLAFQFTQDNQVITQVLPPSTDTRTIIIKNIFAGFSGCQLILTPAPNEFLNGSYQTISLEDDGVQGILLPDGVDHYEFVSYINTTTGSSELEFVGVDGKIITGNKLTSNSKKIRFFENLDGSIDLDVNTINDEGVFAKLGRTVEFNTNYKNAKLSFENWYTSLGDTLGIDETYKAYTIQDGIIGDDPNVSGGVEIEIGAYIKFRNNPIASSDGEVELKLVDPITLDYIIGENDRPITVTRKYKAGEVLQPEVITRAVKAKGSQKIMIDCSINMAGQVVEFDGESCIYIQALDKNHRTGIAKLLWENSTGIRVQTEQYYYGKNFINFGFGLKGTKGEEELDNTFELLGNGDFVDSRGKSKLSIANGRLILEDNGTDLPIFSVGSIVNQYDSFHLRGNQFRTTLTLTDKQNAFNLSLFKWVGQGKAKLPILESYQNQQPIFAQGWQEVKKQFISENVVVGDHNVTVTFDIPDDVEEMAVGCYPTTSQIPTTMNIKNLVVDVVKEFNKNLIVNTFTIPELMLENSEYIAQSKVTTPSGDTEYRYTSNKAPTKQPIGKVTGAKGNLFNNNAWFDSGSSDPNKTQGDLQAKRDLTVKVSFRARAFNETSTDNQADFYFAKVVNGQITSEISDKVTSVVMPSVVNKTTKELEPQFIHGNITLKLKAGESYRFIAQSDKNDGFYLMSDTDGVPLLDFIYDVIGYEDVAVPNLDDSIIEIVDGGKVVTGKKLVYDIGKKTFEVVDK